MKTTLLFILERCYYLIEVLNLNLLCLCCEEWPGQRKALKTYQPQAEASSFKEEGLNTTVLSYDAIQHHVGPLHVHLKTSHIPFFEKP